MGTSHPRREAVTDSFRASEARWGPADTHGAANEITPVTITNALRIPKQGRVFDLSHEISRESPRDFDQSPYSLCMWAHPTVSEHEYQAVLGATNGIGFASERVEMDLHTGTHIDGLGHCSVNGTLYNGISVRSAVGNGGLKKLGIEKVPPLICRGILIDLPNYLGRDLEGGEVVRLGTLQAALQRQAVSVQSGDIVLVRTGWSRHYEEDNETYLRSAPGICLEAAEWLGERHVVAVGSDTLALEVVPSESPAAPYAVHQYLLARCGIYIIENAQLDELAQEAGYEFLCLCLPARFRGATASPIRLSAVL